MSLKVLLAVHHLEKRGGSELYVYELAQALAERGVNVAVFALLRGALAVQLESESGVTVFGPSDMLGVQRFAPDIVHTPHLTTFHLMGEMLPGVPRVHGILGVVPALEQPPSNVAEARRVFAVSERVAERVLARAPQLASVEIVRNWFDERQLVQLNPYTVPDDRPHRVLVVSRHRSPDRDAALAALEAERFAVVTRVGDRATDREITGTFLQQHDAVITIGRTVLLAGAVGVPCIVADQEMSDGLLTHDVVDRFAQKNFTGRSLRRAITAEHLRGEILRSKHIDREALSRKIRAEYGLGSRARHFMTAYESVLREAPAEPPADPRVAHGEGKAYRELALRIARLEAALTKAEAKLAAKQESSSP